MSIEAILLSMQLEKTRFSPTLEIVTTPAIQRVIAFDFGSSNNLISNHLLTENTNLAQAENKQSEASPETIKRIQREQDNNISTIATVTAQYGNDETIDRLAEQAERLNRFASKLQGTPDQIYERFSGIYITNSSEYGSIVAQRDFGAFSNPKALSPLGTIFGSESNIRGLSDTQRNTLITRFKTKFLALRERLQKVIDTNEGKQLSLRGLLANYLAVGGVFPGEGVPNFAREETPRTREGKARETPREEPIREIEGGLPCRSSLKTTERLALLKERLSLPKPIIVAGDLDRLGGDYNLKSSTDGALEALRCVKEGWSNEFKKRYQYHDTFSQLPLEDASGFYKYEPPALKNGKIDWDTINNNMRKGGVIDSKGRIWNKDYGGSAQDKFHFDVQTFNRRQGKWLHTNVNPDGTFYHGTDNFNKF